MTTYTTRGNIANILVGAMAMLLGWLVLPGASTAAPPEDDTYLLGVFPHLPPRELEQVFSPMAVDLGEAVPRTIVLRSNTTYARFSENLDKQLFDIAFVQPFDYVRAADRHGYLPLATRTEKLAAILVVKQDSPLKDISDFRGKTIALPPETAAVSQLLTSHLREHGMEPGRDLRLTYHRSHVSCMQQVLIGEADGCGTAAPALRFFGHKMNIKLEVVDSTREIPHTLFAIHPRVPEAEREQIRQRILSWADSEHGRVMLERGRLKPFVPISDADYDVVREMARKP